MTLADDARDALLRLVRSLSAGESEEALAALDDLEVVATEADELASTVDAGDLPDAVDLSELTEVIDVESIARAIVSGDAGDAVDTSDLLDILELGELFDAVDVREFWRNAEELEAAIEESLGEEALAEWKARLDETTDDGDGDLEVEWTDLADTANSESMQTVIQMQMRDAVDEFREGVLAARKELVKRREELGERTGSVGQPDSRNPSAFSTMVASRSDIGDAAKFSTVPAETRYSSAPNRERIYGSRFEDPGDDTEENDA